MADQPCSVDVLDPLFTPSPLAPFLPLLLLILCVCPFPVSLFALFYYVFLLFCCCCVLFLLLFVRENVMCRPGTGWRHPRRKHAVREGAFRHLHRGKQQGKTVYYYYDTVLKCWCDAVLVCSKGGASPRQNSLYNFDAHC